MPSAIVIFGAAARADGAPSPSLHRRILYGLEAARRAPDFPIFCSGGQGREGPSEASVMQRVLLSEGVEPDRLFLDEVSQDTLQNVVAAAGFIRAAGLDAAVICTDSYHTPRVRMLFRALGVSAEVGPVVRGRGPVSASRWAYMRARELVAYVYDFAVISHRRRELRALIGQG